MLNFGVRSQYMPHMRFMKDDLLDIESLLDVGGNKIVIAVPTTRARLLRRLGRQLR